MAMADKPQLTHLDAQGAARMVDVGHKAVTARQAVAEGFIVLRGSTLRAIADESVPKGEVIATARLAGIMAAKRCGELIPLAHSLPIESVSIDFDIPELEPDDNAACQLRIRATARISGKTGVEMEALTAVSVAALTVYDMCKALSHSMRIGPTKLLSKRGGKRDIGAAR